VKFWGTLWKRRSLTNGTGVAKFTPRSVDNHSFGIPDFEPLLNSHQAAQLLDIHRKTLQKLARRGEIHGSQCWENVAFPRIRSERVAGLSGTSELNIDLNGGRKSAGSLLLCPPLMSSVSGIHIHLF
jgi:hypothetical protein